MSWQAVSLFKASPGKNRARRKLWTVRWYGSIDITTGKPKRYSKSFSTKAQAARFKSEKENEIRKTGRRDRVSGVSLKTLCDAFIRAKQANIRTGSLGLYKNTIRRLLKHFGRDRNVSTIKKKDADVFVGEQVYRQDSKTELSTWARAQIVTHCRTIFKAAVRWGMTMENPFAETEKPKTLVSRWHHLRPDEYLGLLDQAPSLRWRALLAILYTSGVRMGEAFSLTWADVDFEAGTIKIENRPGSPTAPPFRLKAHERRSIPLPQRTLDILTRWQAESPEAVPFIFLTADRYRRVLARWKRLGYVDRRWQNRHMVNNCNRDFQALCKRAQIAPNGKLTVHTLRKSYGQNHAMAGTAIKTLQYLMGHSNERTTLKYYQQVDPASAATAAAKLDAMIDAADQNADVLDARSTQAQFPGQAGEGRENVSVETELG